MTDVTERVPSSIETVAPVVDWRRGLRQTFAAIALHIALISVICYASAAL